MVSQVEGQLMQFLQGIKKAYTVRLHFLLSALFGTVRLTLAHLCHILRTFATSWLVYDFFRRLFF